MDAARYQRHGNVAGIAYADVTRELGHVENINVDHVAGTDRNFALEVIRLRHVKNLAIRLGRGLGRWSNIRLGLARHGSVLAGNWSNWFFSLCLCGPGYAQN